jgi:hypothetical protein
LRCVSGAIGLPCRLSKSRKTSINCTTACWATPTSGPWRLGNLILVVALRITGVSEDDLSLSGTSFLIQGVLLVNQAADS